MNYDDPYQDLYIHYEEGMQHLSGQQALEVCRFRHNNDNTGYNDTGRMETQRGVLTAIAKKMLSWASIANSKNIALSVIGEGLGYNSDTTTRIYLAQIDTSQVDRANKMILNEL